MSPRTQRPLQVTLPLHLEHDLLRGPRVWITDAANQKLAYVDRPVAEWLVELVEHATRGAS